MKINKNYLPSLLVLTNHLTVRSVLILRRCPNLTRPVLMPLPSGQMLPIPFDVHFRY